MAAKGQMRLKEAIQLHSGGRWKEAEEIYRELIEAKFRRADVKHLLGVVRVQQGAVEEGVEYIREALRAKPRAAQVHNHLANALMRLNRVKEAIKHYRQAVALMPKLSEAWSNLGNALLEAGAPEEAVKMCRKAVVLTPRLAEAHLNLSLAYQEMGRLKEAAAASEKASRLRPRFWKALAQRALLAQRLCRWDEVERLHIAEGVQDGHPVVQPLAFLALSDDPAAQRQAAENYLAAEKLARIEPLPSGEPVQSERLRVGYLSVDFHDHAVMHLCAGMFESHDRAAFEVHGFSLGPAKEDAMRERLESAFEHFHDVRELSDEEIAVRIRELGIEVLVDLVGLTSGHRLGVLARRPVPVQVSYMGYPGTTGSSFHDAILADDFVIPARAEDDYSEKVVRLPRCYLATDHKREIGAPPERADLGLPEEGVVFCSFNQAQKITREVFAVWMRLLEAVPGSVLWLFEDNPGAATNLKAAAGAQGIGDGRLVFAKRVPSAEHLGRLRRADLYLDTFPYNGHTTLADALWAGVPGVTCAGRSFASRVAGSLLQAVGLEELVTADLAAFESTARELATNREKLEIFRQRLEENRSSTPVFDTPGFTKEMEAAFRKLRAGS